MVAFSKLNKLEINWMYMLRVWEYCCISFFLFTESTFLVSPSLTLSPFLSPSLFPPLSVNTSSTWEKSELSYFPVWERVERERQREIELRERKEERRQGREKSRKLRVRVESERSCPLLSLESKRVVRERGLLCPAVEDSMQSPWPTWVQLKLCGPAETLYSGQMN